MRTVNDSSCAESVEKKSKFFACLSPASSEIEAKNVIGEISQKYPDATHIVYAYTLIENGTLRAKCSDAKEPKNTAGRPILELLKKLELINVIVVVARYFGGVKLGAPGLARAYSKSAKLSIEKARIIDFVKKIAIKIETNYDKINLVQKLVAASKNCEIIDKQFADKAVFKIPATEELARQLSKNRIKYIAISQ